MLKIFGENLSNVFESELEFATFTFFEKLQKEVPAVFLVFQAKVPRFSHTDSTLNCV